MSRRAKVITLLLAALIGAGLWFRTPIRKAWNRAHPNRTASTGILANPEGIAFDPDGTIYVGNQDTSDISVLNPDGTLRLRFSTLDGYVDGDGQPGPISRGLFMTCPSRGRLILVARHNIAEIDLRGPAPKLARTIGRRGSGPGEMDGPEGLARDVNGDLYVTDEHNRRINVFDDAGAFLRSLPVPQDPQGVAVLGDRLYVSLNKRNYISVLDKKDGRELFRVGHEALYPYFCWGMLPAAGAVGLILLALKRRWAALAAAGAIGLACAAACLWDDLRHDAPGECRHPDHLQMSPDGKRLYVSDRFNGRIQVFHPDGAFLFGFGAPGRGPGEFNDPIQTAFDAAGNFWVCDSDNHRLQVFTPDGKFTRTVP